MFCEMGYAGGLVKSETIVECTHPGAVFRLGFPFAFLPQSIPKSIRPTLHCIRRSVFK